MSIFLGDRLGWYRSLAADGPATPPGFAARTGTHPRYAREWLEQQAVTGLLDVDPDGAADERVFAIPPARPRCSPTEQPRPTWRRSPGCSAPSVRPSPRLLEAYRTGGGVSWDELGADAARPGRRATGRGTSTGCRRAGRRARPARLLSAARGRILDVGCGGGWSRSRWRGPTPTPRSHGFDIDAPSIEMATRERAAAGVADRVSFSHGDAATLPDATFDVAFAFECVHDMPRPSTCSRPCGGRSRRVGCWS